MITLELICKGCGNRIFVDADELAGQEIIDKLAKGVKCNRCAPDTSANAKASRAEYRNPHND